MKKDLDSTHVFQNGTGQQLIDSIEDVAKRLSTIAIVKSADIDLTNYEHIQKIVQLGMAKDYFEIGDQIHTTWKPDDDHEYDMPWDVVDFGPCEDPDGNVHENAMWLQSHYAVGKDLFDNCEAFYVQETEMPAGTYHFTLGVATQYFSSGTKFQFTLSNSVPAGGQLAFCNNNGTVINMTKKNVNGFKIGTFANGLHFDYIELVEASIGDDGVDLGVLSVNTPWSEYGFNDIIRTMFGCNRWSQSSMRQWLNSAPGVMNWWKPQNKFDRYYEAGVSKKNFKSCIRSDFLQMVKPVSISAILCGTYKLDIGPYEKTCDSFFIPSIRNYYGEMADVENEGNEFEYYTRAKEQEVWFEKEDIISKNKATYLFLRTPNVTTAAYLYAIYKQNIITPGRNADYSNGYVAPCCVIY